MEKEILMPKLRPEMKEAVLCAWLKEEGEEVKVGEPIYEIETDKVVTQVESSFDGVLKSKLYEEGIKLSNQCKKYIDEKELIITQVNKVD